MKNTFSVLFLVTFILIFLDSSYTIHSKNRDIENSLSPQAKSMFLIENAFYAYFPQKPILINHINSGGIEFLFYSNNDFDNSIFYNAAYGIWDSHVKKSLRNETLKNMMNGEISSLNGQLLSLQETNVNGEEAIIFSYKYEAGGAKRLKYKVLVQLKNTTCSWGLHGIIGKSDRSAKEIFYKKLTSFTLIK